MSDELEFQINEDDLVFNSTDGKKKTGLIDGGLLDLDDIDETAARPLKRGSTQATAAGEGFFGKNYSSEQD